MSSSLPLVSGETILDRFHHTPRLVLLVSGVLLFVLAGPAALVGAAPPPTAFVEPPLLALVLWYGFVDRPQVHLTTHRLVVRTGKRETSVPLADVVRVEAVGGALRGRVTLHGNAGPLLTVPYLRVRSTVVARIETAAATARARAALPTLAAEG